MARCRLSVTRNSEFCTAELPLPTVSATLLVATDAAVLEVVSANWPFTMPALPDRVPASRVRLLLALAPKPTALCTLLPAVRVLPVTAAVAASASSSTDAPVTAAVTPLLSAVCALTTAAPTSVVPALKSVTRPAVRLVKSLRLTSSDVACTEADCVLTLPSAVADCSELVT